jgi:hypothetical protein
MPQPLNIPMAVLPNSYSWMITNSLIECVMGGGQAKMAQDQS